MTKNSKKKKTDRKKAKLKPAVSGFKPVAKAKDVFRKLADDKRNYDLKNTCEKAVLDAHYFSAYRGRRVIKAGGPGGRSFSLYIMFISKKAAAGGAGGVNLVRHEYGHTVQLRRIGLIPYLFGIAIPSARSGRVPEPEYYDLVTEVTADKLGGADRPHSSEAVQAGEAYLKSLGKKVPRKNSANK